MINRVIKTVAVSTQNGIKNFSTSAQWHYKVTVAGGIGQPLALLLKQNPLVTHLALYDVAKVIPGVAADLSHINTPTKVTGHLGPCQLADAMRCAHVVVIPAGVPRKPGMTRDDLFSTNASIVRDLTISFSQNSPKEAIMCVVTNPVNSMVPIASEIMKKAKRYDPRRIFGVTTLDLVRASTFVGEKNCMDPSDVSVPVIGGHAGATIVPLLSQSRPPLRMTDVCEIKKLVTRIQEAGTEVVKAKAGGGSATLSMAYAAARFTCSVLRGLSGEPNVVECAYVKSDVCDAPYFSSPLLLGKNGVEKILGYGCLNDMECEMLKKAIPMLIKNIKAGEDFVKKSDKMKC